MGTERLKQREFMVKEYLSSILLGPFTYYHDQTLPCSPNRRRPDFVWVLHDRIVILEVDEDAHRHYNRECEIARITELMEQSRGLPMFLIRFNPLESLLEEVGNVLRDSFTRRVTALLDVQFIGYKQEYDVAEAIDTLGRMRRQVD